MPAKLEKADREDVVEFERLLEPEMVGRNCGLEPYKPTKVSYYELTGDMIAYASPDSTYAVTKRLMDAAKESIEIAIYDFTAEYMKELLLKAMQRGVKVFLKLDLDNRTGETEIFEELVKYGCDGVPAPSCASENARYFASSHEKVIVIDKAWTLVQSGNYSDRSIPLNETEGDRDNFVPGNRDMGVAIKSTALAELFSRLMHADAKLELSATRGEAIPSGFAENEELELFVEKPAEPPIQLYPSKTFNPARNVKVQLILSPENYMTEIPDFLESATKSVYLEQQYIRGHQPNIGELLERIRKAQSKNSDLDVRIVLARPMGGGKRFDKEAKAIKQIGKDFGFKLGQHIRILNPQYFTHCHNKLVIVDEQTVLLSSQNWSDYAVTKNREAGLLLHYPEMAQYYARIFEDDWNTGLQNLKRAKLKFYGPEALGTGKVIEISPGDYATDPEPLPMKPAKRHRRMSKRR